MPLALPHCAPGSPDKSRGDSRPDHGIPRQRKAQADIQRLRVGDRGKFYPESGYPNSLEMRLVSIDQDAARELSEGMLALSHGGAIAVREQARALIPERAIYRVVLEIDAGQELSTYSVLRGQVVLHGTAQAWLLSHARTALAVIRREAGF